MKGNVLITGGAGFIGTHIAERLLNNQYKVKILDNLSRNAIKYTDILKHENVEFIEGDILDFKTVAECLKDCEIVVHLAAVAGVSNYYKYPAKTYKTNLVGTYNLLEELIPNNIKRLIDLSTSEIYGPYAPEVDEKSYCSIGPPDDKRWCYAASKIGGEQLVYRYSEEYGINSTIIRPCNVYGPRQVGEGAISNFCRNIVSGRKLKVEGNGMAIRSWCYIDDFIDVFEKIITFPHPGIESFNIGNPWTLMTTVQLAETVIKVAYEEGIIKRRDLIEYVPMEFTEIKIRYPSVKKVCDLYKWKPTINLETGVKHTLNWFKRSDLG